MYAQFASSVLSGAWRERTPSVAELRDQVLLVAALVGLGDDLGDGHLPIIGDVEVVADLVAQAQLALLLEDLFQEAAGLILQCDIDGEAEISDATGRDSTSLEGTVVLRRASSCTTEPCWFSIESLEIDADNWSSNGYVGRYMHASLAFQGFGLVDDSTDEGTIAHRMFELDVTMSGSTPSTSPQSYAFRMGNSTPAVFEVSATQFQIVDAYFEWDDYALSITTELVSCTCLNCS